MNDQDATEAPMLRIVRGRPDEAEIAALAVATASFAAAGAAPDEPPPSMSMWADRFARLRHPAGRRPLRPAPGAWRASALPY